MTNRAVHSHIATAAFFLAALSISPPLLAQTPVRVTIPGTAFSAEGLGDNVTVDNVAGGRRFRGKAFAKVILRGTLQLPAPSSADPRMQRLVIHLRTSQSGPSLRSVELRNGTNTAFHLQTHVAGDYTTRETTQPESAANAWAWDRVPIRVFPDSVLRLEVQFPGGFDSQINPGEFVLTGVVVDFPRKAVPLPTTIPSTSATIPSTGAATRPGRGVLIERSERVVTPPVLSGASRGVIYAVAGNSELLWYGHTGHVDGSINWAAPQGKTIGSGWDFKEVFPGGDGVIYAITSSGDLLWYRHDGHGDGSATWVAPTGKKIGNGWNFAHVFPGGGGVIYAITDGGDLLWYRHDGRNDGSAAWAAHEGKKVGSGWIFKHVFAGSDGVIYAVTANDDLLWYRHDGREDGSVRWAASQGIKVGNGWGVTHVFSAGDGVIYAVMPNGDLLWNRHDGRADGSFKWAAPTGKKVGSGWVFKEVFSGERLGS